MAALKPWRAAWPALLLLGGCAAVDPGPLAPTPPSAPDPAAPAAATLPASPHPASEPHGSVRLQCDGGTELRVAFADDEAHVSGLADGEQVLLRDAGGVTPEQSVYTNEAVRAEFGLGPDAREAALLMLQSQARLHCVRR